jgi:predicted DNA-binding protein YlxM (UPF0122 family)
MRFDKEVLEEMYWNQGLSITEIASRVKSNPATVRYWMKKHEIPRRQRDEAFRKAVMRLSYNVKSVDKETLSHLYLDLGLSIEAIAKNLHCSRSKVSDWIRKYGLPVRSRSESLVFAWKRRKEKSLNAICDYCGKRIHKSPSSLKLYKHHYCSKDCQAKGQDKKIKGRCDYCGKVITIKRCYNKFQHHYCSRKCLYLHRKNELSKLLINGYKIEKEWFREHQNEGFIKCKTLPDFVKFLPRGRLKFVEVKSSQGFWLSKQQKETFAKLKQLGFEVTITYPENGKWVDVPFQEGV